MKFEPTALPQKILLIVLLCALWILLWFPRLTGPIDLRFDAGVYYILGTSIAEGKGYRLLNEPGEIEALQYPPLLPIIVAAHQWVLGTNDYLVVGPWLRLFNCLLFGAYIFAVFRMALHFLSPSLSMVVTIISMLSLNTYYLSDLLYTELPFSFLATLFVLLHRTSDRIAYSVFNGLLAVAAFFLRTAGIALLVAWVAESLFRRKYKEAVFVALIAILSVGLWQTYIDRIQSSEQYHHLAYEYQRASYNYSNVSYLENARLISPFFPEQGTADSIEMVNRIATNLLTIPVAVGESVSMPMAFWRNILLRVNETFGTKVAPLSAVYIPILLIGGLVIGGALILIRRKRLFLPLFITTSMGIICITPWPEQFTRYLTPLTPVLVLFMMTALHYSSELANRRFTSQWNKVAGLFGILLIASILFVQAFWLPIIFAKKHQFASYYDGQGKERVHRLFFYRPPWKALDSAFEWVRRQAERKDIIATSVPHLAYLRTGLKAVLPPMERDTHRAQLYFDSVPVKYAILDDLEYPGISQRYAGPAVEHHPEHWKLAYTATNGKARVYERIRN